MKNYIYQNYRNVITVKFSSSSYNLSHLRVNACHVNKYGFQTNHDYPINSLDTVESKALIGSTCLVMAAIVVYMVFPINPLSASYSCDARIGGCRQNGLLVPRSPFSRHPPIKKGSLCHCKPLTTAFHSGYQCSN